MHFFRRNASAACFTFGRGLLLMVSIVALGSSALIQTHGQFFIVANWACSRYRSLSCHHEGSRREFIRMYLPGPAGSIVRI